MASKVKTGQELVDGVNDLIGQMVLDMNNGSYTADEESKRVVAWFYNLGKFMQRKHDERLADDSELRIVGKRGRKASSDGPAPESVGDLIKF